MTIISSILNWIGNTIGDDVMGTTATTLKGAIAELKAVLDPLPDAVDELDTKVDDNATWKKLGSSPVIGKQSTQTLPNDAHEAYVTVAIQNTANSTAYVTFFVPAIDDMFKAYSANSRVVNYYGATNDGYCTVGLYADESSAKVFRMISAFSGTTEVTNTVEWNVYYR